MPGYLLDTNILSYLSYPDGNPCRRQVKEKLASLDRNAFVFMSAISWGEFEYGWRCCKIERIRVEDRKEMARFRTLTISKATGSAYAELKTQLFDKFSPKDNRSKRRVEQLVVPTTGHALGVDENDVWITAQAIEHKLILVSHDKMHNIKAVANQTGLIGFEDWAGA